MSLRISSLDYLGVVAARLRRDAVQSRLKIDTINAIIETVKEAEEEAGETVEEDSDLEEEEQRTRFLQRVLLDYLAVNGGEVSQKCAAVVGTNLDWWLEQNQIFNVFDLLTKSPENGSSTITWFPVNVARLCSSPLPEVVHCGREVWEVP